MQKINRRRKKVKKRKKQNKTKAKEPHGDKKKKSANRKTAVMEEEEEEEEQKEETADDQERRKRRINEKGAGSSRMKRSINPLCVRSRSILHWKSCFHHVLKWINASRYASVSYRTAFIQYQSTGLRAHLGWLLFAKYKLSKKEVKNWLNAHFPEQLLEDEKNE